MCGCALTRVAAWPIMARRYPPLGLPAIVQPGSAFASKQPGSRSSSAVTSENFRRTLDGTHAYSSPSSGGIDCVRSDEQQLSPSIGSRGLWDESDLRGGAG